MREIKSQIPLSSSRMLSILRQHVINAISPIVPMNNFLDSKHTSQSLYRIFSSVTDTINPSMILLYMITLGTLPIVLPELGISNSTVLLLSIIAILSLFQAHTQIQSQIQILTETIEFQNNELLLDLDQSNSFFEEQKSSFSVYVQNSENDQRYQAAGFDSDQVPVELICPLTNRIFTTPVRLEGSNAGAVELSALWYWFNQRQKDYPYQQPTHPLTREVLDMKNLVIDEKLAKKAKNFVENKIARIGNLLIYSSRLFTQLEREQCIGLFATYTFIALELSPPKSFQNLVIGLSLFNTLISHLPAPRKQILKALTVYAHCANFFRESQSMAVRNSNSQNPLSITYRQSKL